MVGPVMLQQLRRGDRLLDDRSNTWCPRLTAAMILSGSAMLQTAIGDGLALDPFAFEEDGLSAPEVDVSRSEIAEALVIAGMVVVLDEGRDLAFEIAGLVVVLEQDAVLERLMPALDLALGLRMERRSASTISIKATICRSRTSKVRNLVRRPKSWLR